MNDGVVITGVGLEAPNVMGSCDAPRASGDHFAWTEADAVSRLGRRGLRYKDQATQLALCAAQASLRDASLPTDAKAQIAPAAFGVVASSNLGNLDTICRVVRTLHAARVAELSPMDLPNASSNVVASTTAIWFGLKGPNLMLCNGATSGTDALHVGRNLILTKRAVRVLVIGVEPANCVVDEFLRVSFMRWLKDDTPVGTFAGAAAVVLESWAEARTRRVRYYARLGAYGHCGGLDLGRSLLSARAHSTSPPDFWFSPARSYRPTAEVVNAWAERLEREGATVLDLQAQIGESYGAAGVLQTLFACKRFEVGAGRVALATSGLCLQDGAATIALECI